ncbi:hypothetical protein BDK51DRAFT_36754 [Blyttiomyces helicus]|uniref:RGS domain-containing protein n=1 Tax=Blyttiomyces helicus TaxID=388810 RepID=A0A4P9VUR6_9FUNG|nr:hypothetical protein BDK51DRAFT_36754 [Blyttiomyces helicus]|eukprot:RKO83349.1 hypothetical protein BDK51DRAFT_36754 [Blyttiomyces helicus]
MERPSCDTFRRRNGGRPEHNRVRLEGLRSSGSVTEAQFAPLYAYGIVMILFIFPYLVWRLKGISDARGVRRDLQIIILGSIGCYALFFIWQAMPQTVQNGWPPILWHVSPSRPMNKKLTTSLRFPSPLSWKTFLTLGQSVMVVMPVLETLKGRHKGKNASLAHNMDSFLQVLADKTLFKEFKEFAMSDFCVENALFLEACEELETLTFQARTKSGRVLWAPGRKSQVAVASGSSLPSKSHVSILSAGKSSDLFNGGAKMDPSAQPGTVAMDGVVPESAVAHYRNFYETYVRAGARYEVNIPSSVRSAIKEQIASVCVRACGRAQGSCWRR